MNAVGDNGRVPPGSRMGGDIEVYLDGGFFAGDDVAWAGWTLVAN